MMRPPHDTALMPDAGELITRWRVKNLFSAIARFQGRLRLLKVHSSPPPERPPSQLQDQPLKQRRGFAFVLQSSYAPCPPNAVGACPAHAVGGGKQIGAAIYLT